MAIYGLDPVLGYHPKVVEISNSELSCFKEDRRKWMLAYYLGLEPKAKRVDGPLVLGTRVHNALEQYYIQGMTAYDALDLYVKYVQEERLWIVEVDGGDPARFDKEAELGRVMLEGYFEWLEETGADSTLEVISAEEKLSAPIMDGRVILIGKLDMRMRRKTDGVRLIVDHKTCATFDSIRLVAHLNWQPKMYTLLEALKLDEKERCDGMVYNMLRKTKRTANAKPPFYDRMEVHHNRQTLEAFWYQLNGVVRDIMATREALDNGVDHNLVCYPNPTQDSTWKDQFFMLGPLMDDGSAAERFVDDFYVQHNPYERYQQGV